MPSRRLTALTAILATGAWLSSVSTDGIRLQPAPAAAFPAPCMTPQGYLIICCPKPCPVLDPQKLPSEITKLQQEAQKLASMAQQLKQWQATLQSIGSNPARLLNMLGAPSDLKAFKGLVPPIANKALAGADFSTIGGSKNAIANLFFNPATPAGVSARLATVTDAKLNAVATGLHARSSMETGDADINKIVADAKKTQTVRDELAIANRIRLAFLQALKNQNAVAGSMLELFGSASALSLGSENAGPNAYSGGTTPYAPIMTPPAPPLSDKAAIDLAAATRAMMSAVDIHNGFAAVGELAHAIADVAAIQNEQKAVDAAAASTRQALIQTLSPIYANAPAAADAILTQGKTAITAPWPDSFSRASQQDAAASAAIQTMLSNPDAFGQPTCRALSCYGEGRDPTAALHDAIFSALETAEQSAWYTTLTNNAADLRNTLASEADSLSANLGVDITSQSAVQDAITHGISVARDSLAAFATAKGTADQSAKAADVAKTLDNLTNDPGFANYIPYDPSLPATPTGSALLATTK